MKKTSLYGIIAIVCLLVVVVLFDYLNPQKEVDFSTEIKPILNKHCITCHGGVKQNSGFSLLFEKDALGDTKSGEPAIIPGDASGSELIRRIKEDDPELRMPYEKPKLSDEEIELLTLWVDQGAKWGIHWAYTLPDKVEIPLPKIEAGMLSTDSSDFIQNDIDNFILSKLIAEDLTPSPKAANEIIARRLALDLTGLPPDKKTFDHWINGEMSYEAMVDILLSKETYGEKWASWWLDLARYADSKGYEKDMGRTIWEYRDWVIRSLNKDMPYDQFTVEQLAGDLILQPSADQLIATAFHRNTMNNDEGGTDDEEFRVATVLDRVNTTFSVWQSTTMECVQCHSHPYDPFKHQDYYSLMAFFNNTRDEDTPDESPALKFYSPEQQKDVDNVMKWVSHYDNKKTSEAYGNFLRFTEPVYKSHNFRDFVNGAYDDHASVVLWDNGSCIQDNVFTNNASSIYLKYNTHFNNTKITLRENNARGQILATFTTNKTKGAVIKKFPFKKIDKQTSLFIEVDNDAVTPTVNAINIYWVGFLEDLPGEGQTGFTGVDRAMMRVLNAKTPTVPIMAENPGFMKRTTQLFERGNWLLKADTVQPATPETLGPWNEQWPDDRLGLSKWIVDKKNPLTARTLVNRVWHQIFGQGIVTSLEDMGSQSDPPSHPELLDWLSLRFMNEHEWSIKALIKDIVMSGTYRQKSESNPELYQIDPENLLYARGPRERLSAEQIRDQALAVSGLLSDKMYGPGVMPPQPDGVWQTVYNGAKWMESSGEDRYRRALYTYLKRTSPYPSFLTFDAVSREVCTVRRTVTNTPLQALITLNDPVYLEAAYHLAKNSMVVNEVEKSIAASYEAATYSRISASTLNILKALYQNSLAEFKANSQAAALFLPYEKQPSAELSAMTVVANAIMNLDEFLTKA